MYTYVAPQEICKNPVLAKKWVTYGDVLNLDQHNDIFKTVDAYRRFIDYL